uniref:CUB domain-containing protein n=1 Tax=Romanomermis culicivorax TaxID=13658 RepID=A0A915LAL0_ROMCU
MLKAESKFRTKGRKFPHTLCDYHISSIPLDGTTRQVASGEIFSPEYPYYYPPGQTCRYWFSGPSSQHVKITVHKVDMTPRSGSCLKSSDSLSIYDGKGPPAGDLEAPILDPLLAHFCDKSDQQETGQGFHLSYEFLYQLPRKTLDDNSVLKFWRNLSTSDTFRVLSLIGACMYIRSERLPTLHNF